MAAKGGYIDTVEAILAANLPPKTLNAVAGFVSGFQYDKNVYTSYMACQCSRV